MNSKWIFCAGMICASAIFSSCDSSRTNTKRGMDESSTEHGDSLDPTEGIGEGTKGHKFMETSEEDSLANVEQD